MAPTILKLLSREELSQLKYYDRETDPSNPSFRTLSDLEQQRILINTMIGARKLQSPEVQQQLRKLTESDPSPRVRAAGRELLADPSATPVGPAPRCKAAGAGSLRLPDQFRFPRRAEPDVRLGDAPQLVAG